MTLCNVTEIKNREAHIKNVLLSRHQKALTLITYPKGEMELFMKYILYCRNRC